MIPIADNTLFKYRFYKTEPLISPIETEAQNGISMG
jgi:hypothetical protein